MNFIDPLKTLIKKNIILTILSDYVISFLGFNFEKEYRIINLIKKKILQSLILVEIEVKVFKIF